LYESSQHVGQQPHTEALALWIYGRIHFDFPVCSRLSCRIPQLGPGAE
jgi:hypothetical protein